ncbi:MAG: hypothetical protein HYY76_12185 [Acidobacteria bacterium]|nr:hypothetical protein [Acidobacteriota bacterium]
MRRHTSLDGRIPECERSFGREPGVDDGVDCRQPGPGDPVAALDQHVSEIVGGAPIAEARLLHDRPNRLVRKRSDKTCAPEGVVRPHIVERGVGVLGLPACRLERLRIDATDGRRQVIGTRAPQPRRNVQAQAEQCGETRAALQQVLMARARTVGKPGRAPEDRPEVEHVVANERASGRGHKHVEGIYRARIVVVQPRRKHAIGAQFPPVLVRVDIIRIVRPCAVVLEVPEALTFDEAARRHAIPAIPQARTLLENRIEIGLDEPSPA